MTIYTMIESLQAEINRIRPSLKGLGAAIALEMGIPFTKYTTILNGRNKNEETLTKFLSTANIVLMRHAEATADLAKSITVNQ